MNNKLLLGTSFEFREKASGDVSVVWKIIHIISYIPIGISGITTYVTFGRIMNNFESHCILYGNPSFKVQYNTSKYYIDLLTSKWSRRSMCEFCEYVFCSSFIIAITWITFFTLCGRGGSSISWLPQGWRIVMPAFICNIIYFGISFSAALLVDDGYKNFLRSMSDMIKFSGRCHNLNIYIGKIEENNKRMHYWRLDTDSFCISRESSWATCGLWLFATLITLMRIICAADFTLVNVAMYVQDPGLFKGTRLTPLEETDEDVTSNYSDSLIAGSNDKSIDRYDIATQTSLTMANFRHVH